jgi:hypothetical protein
MLVSSSHLISHLLRSYLLQQLSLVSLRTRLFWGEIAVKAIQLLFTSLLGGKEKLCGMG